MTTKSVGANTLKSGSYLVMEGAACKVGNIQISRPGKHGHAKMRIEGVGILDGKKRIIVLPGHDHVEVPVIEKKTAQVLSVQGNTANVMDSETYETFDIKIPEELKADCQAGVNVLYWQVLNDKIMKQVKSGEQ
ncbi:translation initiation factor IF-5A [Candidatus Woesearchaeota archaeon]|nr:translation initiation factor IF-5A [Candidatus Woesearchaeota archaeon]|tara:strand:+ start:14805 stop:15206 length:402 start_codon:yes stop_codon:yes gene_type:complete